MESEDPDRELLFAPRNWPSENTRSRGDGWPGSHSSRNMINFSMPDLQLLFKALCLWSPTVTGAIFPVI